jgi:CO/xanthine dehydrogenase FAD-binding subunit
VDLIDVEEVLRPQSESEIPAWRPGDAYVAGGTWLFSEPQPGIRRLIDLTDIPRTPLEQTSDGVRIAATCTYEELESNTQILDRAGPLFSRAIRTLSSSFKTYGVATVGGNLCLAYAKSMMAPVCCALGATYELATPEGGRRNVAATQFQTGARETVLRSGEYMRAVFIPAAATRGSYALRGHSYSPTSHATAMVIAARQPGLGGNGSRPPGRAALVVSAAVTHPVRVELSSRTDAADGTDAPDARDVADAAVGVCDHHPMLDDGHGSAAYRKALLRHLAAEAWAAVRAETIEEEPT